MLLPEMDSTLAWGYKQQLLLDTPDIPGNLELHTSVQRHSVRTSAGSLQQQHWLQLGVSKTGHMSVVDPGLQQLQHTAAPGMGTHHMEHLHLVLHTLWEEERAHNLLEADQLQDKLSSRTLRYIVYGI